MSVVNVLPNGSLVITLTPREAVAVGDELLEPSEYPWQSNESQMIAMELKVQLKSVVEQMAVETVKMLATMVPQPRPEQPPNDE